MGYKYDSTPFCFKYIAFRCGRSIFALTVTEADRQDTTFVITTLTTKNNRVRGEKIGHKASGDPIMRPKAALLRGVLHLRDNKTTLSTPPIPRHDAYRIVGKYNANNDNQYL